MAELTSISVLVVCENKLQKISTTLHSVLSQVTEITPEIILINSGNVEGFGAWARRFQEFPWAQSLRIVGQERSKDLQRVAKSARGDLVVVLKSGDALLPEALSRMSGYLNKHSLDVVIAGAGSVGKSGGMAPSTA